MADSYRDEYLAATKKLDQADAALDEILRTVQAGAGLLQSQRKYAAILHEKVTFLHPAGHNPSWIVDDWPSAERIAVSLKDWQVAQRECENLWSLMDTKQKMGLRAPLGLGN
jgi:hypothetical protein